MTRLTLADPTRLDEILDVTYPAWGEGLSRSAYGAWNRAQMATRWGQDHLRRVALVDDSTLLASAKRYDFRARVGTEVVPVLGVGAVFTPPRHRGRGYARALIELMLEDAAARGCRFAFLFSEIGAAYYESIGFRALPRTLVSVQVNGRRGAPAVFVRSGEVADLPAIADISACYGEGAGFALDRTAELIEFGFARRRLLAGLGPAGLRQAEYFVSEEGHRAVAYVFITRGPAGVVLEECGDRDPTGARIGAILQVLAARAPAEPALRLSAWLPSALRPPQLDVLPAGPAAEVMMIRPLLTVASSDVKQDQIVYWQTDVF